MNGEENRSSDRIIGGRSRTTASHAPDRAGFDSRPRQPDYVQLKHDPRPTTPSGFVREMADAVQHDPGCEVKPMLFRLIDKQGKEQYVHFAGFESGSRCLVCVVSAKDYPQHG